MQSIGASQTVAPIGATYSGLSDGRVQDLRGAGVPEPAISAANSIVSGVQSAQLGNVDPSTVNTIPAGVGTSPAPIEAAPQSLPGGSLQPSVQNGSLDGSFNALTPQHVQLLRLMGFPDANIQQLAASSPNAAAVHERIIWMAQNPEAVDDYLAVPRGTTASRLAQIPQDLFVNPAGPGVGGTSPSTTTDTWDANYPQLLASHVKVFRAIGMNDQQIAYVQQQGWGPTQVEALIQNDIMVQPEAWDAQMGVPSGTVRAGLMSLGLPVQPIGQTPGDAPTQKSGSDDWIMPALLIGGLAIGGFLLHRHFKGKKELAGIADAMGGAGALGGIDGFKMKLGMKPTSMSAADALKIPTESLGSLSKRQLVALVEATRTADPAAGIHPGLWPHMASGGAFAPITDPHIGNLTNLASNMGTPFAERVMLHLERMNLGSTAKVAETSALANAEHLLRLIKT